MADNEIFPIVLRGYDRERVDEEMKRSEQAMTRLREQIKVYDNKILELEVQLRNEKDRKVESGKSSFANLGANAQKMLASAEQTSRELLDRAKQDAAARKRNAAAQAESLINKSKLDAQRTAAQAENHAGEIVRQAKEQADSITSAARDSAEQMTATIEKKVREKTETLRMELAAERELGKHRHLIASATGTGKTVVAAFDYAYVAKDGTVYYRTRKFSCRTRMNSFSISAKSSR